MDPATKESRIWSSKHQESHEGHMRRLYLLGHSQGISNDTALVACVLCIVLCASSFRKSRHECVVREGHLGAPGMLQLRG